MQFIRSLKIIEPERPNGKTIVYMLGYGGRIWQAKRHLNLLQKEGYLLVVLDFIDILRSKKPDELVGLMQEVEDLLKDRRLISKDTLILGVSLGGLVGFNMLKRQPKLTKLLVITGGDMTRIPSPKSLKTKWKVTREELARQWQDVNMYTPPGTVRGKHIVMLLPKRDRVIDPDEVADEIVMLGKSNQMTLVRTNGGHLRTIITETVLRPRNSLPHITRLSRI